LPGTVPFASQLAGLLMGRSSLVLFRRLYTEYPLHVGN
jgi:hypothetical protein